MRMSDTRLWLVSGRLLAIHSGMANKPLQLLAQTAQYVQVENERTSYRLIRVNAGLCFVGFHVKANQPRNNKLARLQAVSHEALITEYTQPQHAVR